MKYVEKNTDLSEIDTNITVTFFDKKGNITDDNRNAFGQIITKQKADGSNHKQYQISTYNNVLYDPMGADGHRKNINLVLKTVDQQTFDYYIMYLKTKNSLYMTRAQRSFING
jgi:hypothetical protein